MTLFFSPARMQAGHDEGRQREHAAQLHAGNGRACKKGQEMTQAEILYRHLRRRWMTAGEMLALGVSVCPWKRVSEGSKHLRDGEKLAKKTTHDGLVAYRVVKG